MATDSHHSPVPGDGRGGPVFPCVDCGRPLAMADFHKMGLREPERGESVSEYMAEELVDDLAHAECFLARRRTG